MILVTTRWRAAPRVGPRAGVDRLAGPMHPSWAMPDPTILIWALIALAAIVLWPLRLWIRSRYDRDRDDGDDRDGDGEARS